MLNILFIIAWAILVLRMLTHAVGGFFLLLAVKPFTNMSLRVMKPTPRVQTSIKFYLSKSYLIDDFKTVHLKLSEKIGDYNAIEMLDELIWYRIARRIPLPVIYCLFLMGNGLPVLSITLAVATFLFHVSDASWCRLASNNVDYILKLYDLEINYGDDDFSDYGH